MTTDQIREAVIDAAKKQNLTAYALAKQIGADPGTIKRWWNGSISGVNSCLASACMKQLGLRVKPTAN